MRTYTLALAVSLVLPLLACTDDADPATDTTAETGSDPGDGDGDASTTASSDGDPSTTGPNPGDGDGDPDPSTGDGDGDPDPSTGDGDGDPDPSTGDGDGDANVCEPPGDDCGDCMAANCCAEIEECLTDVDCSCFQECAAANPDDVLGCADPDQCDIPLLSLLDPNTVVGRMGACTQTNCAQCL